MKLAVIFLLLCTSAFARLGETLPKLVERFGAPKLSIDEQTIAQGKFIKIGERLQFQQDDWGIICTLVEGRCAKISYSKSGDWTNDQIQTILSGNAQGARWTNTTTPGLAKIQKTWKREDGATAVWNMGGMVVTQPAYDRAKKKAEDQAKAAAGKRPNI